MADGPETYEKHRGRWRGTQTSKQPKIKLPFQYCKKPSVHWSPQWPVTQGH